MENESVISNVNGNKSVISIGNKSVISCKWR